MLPRRIEQRDPRIHLPGLYDPAVNQDMWNELPESHRQLYFARRSMPPEYLAAILENRAAYRTREKAIAIRIPDVPQTMQVELLWVLHRTVSLGRTIQAESWSRYAKGLELALAKRQGPRPQSLLSLDEETWMHALRLAAESDGSLTSKLPFVFGQWHRKAVDLLVYRYHRGDWWRLDVWNPQVDRRIALREHEPRGRGRVNFSRLTDDWLRDAAKFWLKVMLENGQYTWSTVLSRISRLHFLQKYIDLEGAPGPHLVDDPSDLRNWCSGFAGWLRTYEPKFSGSHQKNLGSQSRRSTMSALEAFYRFMFDHQGEAARLLHEPRWRLLGPQHTVLFRLAEKPRHTNTFRSDELVLEDEVVAKILQGSYWLSTPREEGGMGDEQALRALMLLSKTGRRVSEITMLDFDPLVPTLQGSGDPDGFTARLRYQQTKVMTNDPTILVDAEVVRIVKAQQEWVRQIMASWNRPEVTPRYLFIGLRSNHLGLRPYPQPTLGAVLSKLADKLEITDSRGKKVRISATHRFRHTKATNLINAGVPIHVVMRYLGHVSPEMTMHYAKTLAETAEREFLKYKKVTADARVLEVDPRDLYEASQLYRRADRILPNGLCLLPPKQFCNKGNACLTCSHFVTDASHRAALVDQVTRTQELIILRQEAFSKRYGQAMGPEHVWLRGRITEIEATQKVLAAIDAAEQAAGPRLAVLGAGARDQ